MKIQKTSSVKGAWVDKSQLKNGQRAKIVGEPSYEPSNFKNADGSNQKDQLIAKVHFEGQKEAVNFPLNQTTINGLVDAFGDDTNGWQGQYLTVDVETGRTAGKASYTCYLIPKGFEKTNDENGYAVIQKVGSGTQTSAPKQDDDIPVIEDNINGEEVLPF